MLVLSRKSGDSIVVDGRIVIHVVKTDKEIGKHTSELQSHHDLVCRLLLEKKKSKKQK